MYRLSIRLDYRSFECIIYEALAIQRPCHQIATAPVPLTHTHPAAIHLRFTEAGFYDITDDGGCEECQ